MLGFIFIKSPVPPWIGTRSAFLRYLEEALAEGYAQLRAHGLSRALGAYRFPITNGYATVSALAAEGSAIGTIILGGTLFHVSISYGYIGHILNYDVPQQSVVVGVG